MPPGGLTIYDLRNYTEDALDAELRASGLEFNESKTVFANKLMIGNWHADNRKKWWHTTASSG